MNSIQSPVEVPSEAVGASDPPSAVVIPPPHQDAPTGLPEAGNGLPEELDLQQAYHRLMNEGGAVSDDGDSPKLLISDHAQVELFGKVVQPLEEQWRTLEEAEIPVYCQQQPEEPV